MSSRTALITGANTGIGLALAQRLLSVEPSIRLCLCCRNQLKAEEALKTILIGHPDADVTLVSLDTSSTESVRKAADVIKNAYTHIDLMYLNAGIMPSPSVDWSAFAKNLMSGNFGMFKTGAGILVQSEGTTVDVLQATFATNLFGHFVLIQELDEVLGGAMGTTQIIWTSSVNAQPEMFSMNDYQHKHGTQPYASSKYATDLISVALNERLNQRGIFSHTTCPGLVMTNLTRGILPWWIWMFLMPILVILRAIVPSTNISPVNGASALLWLATQKPQNLDSMTKFQSRSTVMGHTYVSDIRMSIDRADADTLWGLLVKLDHDLKIGKKS